MRHLLAGAQPSVRQYKRCTRAVHVVRCCAVRASCVQVGHFDYEQDEFVVAHQGLPSAADFETASGGHHDHHQQQQH